jgi:hypothetical protein
MSLVDVSEFKTQNTDPSFTVRVECCDILT